MLLATAAVEYVDVDDCLPGCCDDVEASGWVCWRNAAKTLVRKNGRWDGIVNGVPLFGGMQLRGCKAAVARVCVCFCVIRSTRELFPFSNRDLMTAVPVWH